MVSTLDWKNSEDTRDIVHLAVQALVEGRLVVLPAETAYHVAVSGLSEDAAGQLSELVERKAIAEPVVFLRSPQELLDYVPDVSPIAARMAQRGWPGPLVLELDIDPTRSLAGQLPQPLLALIRRSGRMAFRVAAHDAISQAMRLMPGPVVAAPLIDPQGGAVCEIPSGGLVDFGLVVDDGQTHFDGLATAVRVAGNQCRVIRSGVLRDEVLQRTAQLVVLVVCTGNTCRSPMAEALLREKIALRFPNLQKGKFEPVFIASAGLSAFPGGPASSEAQTVMQKRGLSLKDHQSRSVTERALLQADLVLTMTNSHRNAILDRFPGLEHKVHMVSGGRADVSDPFGGSEAVYAACADQIDGFLDGWMDKLDESWFPEWQMD